MTTAHAEQKTAINWKWVTIGTIICLTIVALAFYVVQPKYHSYAIQMLVMFAGFLLSGMVIGYFSPGVTIKEAAIAAAISIFALVISFFALGASLGSDIIRDIVVAVVGVVFALIGAWAGEQLQGTLGEDEVGKKEGLTSFHWNWVAVGVILGFALNVLTIIPTVPFMKFSATAALVLFCTSSAVAGLIVGYKSPGVTLKEPALAGLLFVFVEFLFIRFGLDLKVPGAEFGFGLLLGFNFTLFGAYFGEVIQEKMESDED
jgi:hypothetical protein